MFLHGFRTIAFVNIVFLFLKYGGFIKNKKTQIEKNLRFLKSENQNIIL